MSSRYIPLLFHTFITSASRRMLRAERRRRLHRYCQAGVCSVCFAPAGWRTADLPDSLNAERVLHATASHAASTGCRHHAKNNRQFYAVAARAYNHARSPASTKQRRQSVFTQRCWSIVSRRSSVEPASPDDDLHRQISCARGLMNDHKIFAPALRQNRLWRRPCSPAASTALLKAMPNVKAVARTESTAPATSPVPERRLTIAFWRDKHATLRAILPPILRRAVRNSSIRRRIRHASTRTLRDTTHRRPARHTVARTAQHGQTSGDDIIRRRTATPAGTTLR